MCPKGNDAMWTYKHTILVTAFVVVWIAGSLIFGLWAAIVWPLAVVGVGSLGLYRRQQLRVDAEERARNHDRLVRLGVIHPKPKDK